MIKWETLPRISLQIRNPSPLLKVEQNPLQIIPRQNYQNYHGKLLQNKNVCNLIVYMFRKNTAVSCTPKFTRKLSSTQLETEVKNLKSASLSAKTHYFVGQCKLHTESLVKGGILYCRLFFLIESFVSSAEHQKRGKEVFRPNITHRKILY